MDHKQITDNLDALLAILPKDISKAVSKLNNNDELLEIVMDLGRVPIARQISEEVILKDSEVTREDIDFVVERLGDVDADNRAGLERSLHRISAIRNRRGDIVGLTCRVGRAVYGTIEIIKDLIGEGKSLLLLGRPGVGKTTMLREAARVLAESKRVVIVDTSNEIGGDGDVPHPAVGKARRMQVATPSLQHEVMIEAVENHNPEVIVIDEIGRKLEAQAARTIAERGVQLIGTAHGNSLENLLLNPTLSDLVGGIESVTLSDEEARRRRTQKTVLERRSAPTFDVLVEIQHRNQIHLHKDVAVAVDELLRGYPSPPEVRTRLEDGTFTTEKGKKKESTTRKPSHGQQGMVRQRNMQNRATSETAPPQFIKYNASQRQEVKIFPFGVARNRLEVAASGLNVPVNLVRSAGDAEVMLTLRTHYRKRQRAIVDAEKRGIPVYVLRSNTVQQMEKFFRELFNISPGLSARSTEDFIVKETHRAIDAVRGGESWVEMPPANSYIRRLQHQLVNDANLTSHSYGKEPNRRVRIFRE